MIAAFPGEETAERDGLLEEVRQDKKMSLSTTVSLG